MADTPFEFPSPSVRIAETGWRDGVARSGERSIAEETAIAFVYDGATEAVMMASPRDLEDFGIGFSLTEGIIVRPDEVRALEIVPQELGVEIRMELSEGQRDVAVARRRHRAGPAGCGLCGIESLESALRPLPRVRAPLPMDAADIHAGMRALAAAQALNRETRAVHAAAFYTPHDKGLVAREDVGRHNALDKVVGSLARAGRKAEGGAVLLTSRVSVELVQKTAMLGVPILAAISAPTALALRMADAAGICVIGIVRDDGMEVFTHPEFVRGPR
jgi:FdhD protein